MNASVLSEEELSLLRLPWMSKPVGFGLQDNETAEKISNNRYNELIPFIIIFTTDTWYYNKGEFNSF